MRTVILYFHSYIFIVFATEDYKIFKRLRFLFNLLNSPVEDNISTDDAHDSTATLK